MIFLPIFSSMCNFTYFIWNLKQIKFKIKILNIWNIIGRSWKILPYCVFIVYYTSIIIHNNRNDKVIDFHLLSVFTICRDICAQWSIFVLFVSLKVQLSTKLRMHIILIFNAFLILDFTHFCIFCASFLSDTYISRIYFGKISIYFFNTLCLGMTNTKYHLMVKRQ